MAMGNGEHKFRYECLHRSRVAKHEVLRRVLRRKISDGKWFDLGGYCTIDREDIAPALKKLQSIRSRLNQVGVSGDEGRCEFLDHFPDVEIGYDDTKQSHYIIF